MGLMGIIGGGGAVAGGGLDPDTTAWVNQVVNVNGGTVSSTSQGFVDTLIKTIKASSTICPSGNLNDTLDQMWLLANFDTTGSSQTTDAQALTSIVNPTASTALATPHGSWSSNTLGWKGNGTTGYVDLGYNPTSFNSSSAKYSQDSACFGVYGLESRAAADTKIAIGSFAGGSVIDQLLVNAVSSGTNAINDGSGLDSTLVSTGLCLNIRNGSAGNQSNCITINSGGTTTKTGTAVSNGNANLKFFAIARNNSTNPDSFETIKIALVFAGGRSGTNAAYAAALYTPIQAYMTSLGIPQ